MHFSESGAICNEVLIFLFDLIIKVPNIEGLVYQRIYGENVQNGIDLCMKKLCFFDRHISVLITHTYQNYRGAYFADKSKCGWSITFSNYA